MGLLTTVSILSSDFSDIKHTLEEASGAGASMIHWDVMDGHFVPNLTFGAKLIDDYRCYCGLVFDTHLMISSPDVYLDSFLKSSDLLTFHWEAAQDRADKLITRIQSAGKKAGISVKPKTPIQVLEPYLTQLDTVLLMGVEPGFGGQVLDDSIFERLKILCDLRDRAKASFRITVDGGVHAGNAKRLRDWGADGVVLGTSFIKASDKKKLIEAVSEVS